MQPLQQLYTCNHGLMYRVIFLTIAEANPAKTFPHLSPPATSHFAAGLLDGGGFSAGAEGGG